MPDIKTPVATLTDGTARCQSQTDSGRQCRLAVHPDDVKHKYMDRSKPAPALPEGFALTAEPVKKGELLTKEVSRNHKPRPRTPSQVAVDKLADRNYKANVQAGHDTSADVKELRYSASVVPPAAVDAILDLLRGATTKGGPAEGGVLRYRKGTHESGNTLIHWALIPKAPATGDAPAS